MKPSELEYGIRLPEAIDIQKGQHMTLTATDGTAYTGYYTESLLHSLGYNQPAVIRPVNDYLRQHQKSGAPVNPGDLEHNLSMLLKPYMPRRLTAFRFASEDIYTPVLDVLAAGKRHPEFLCLERPAVFSNKWAGRLYTLTDLIGEDEQADIHAVSHHVFPEDKTVRTIIRARRESLAGCIISPVLLTDGSLVSKALMENLIQALLKNKVPIIWDDSVGGFFRTGQVFSFMRYDIQPDALIYNSTLTHGHSIHFASLTSKLNKSFPSNTAGLHAAGVPAAILFRSVLDFLATDQFGKKLTGFETRINGKLRALMADTDNAFTAAGGGLTYFIHLKTASEAEAFLTFAREQGLLTCTLAAVPECVCFYPPITITEEAIDEFLQALRLFCKGQNERQRL